MSQRAREAVLERLGAALGRHGQSREQARRAALVRIAEQRPGTIPARSHLPPEGRIALFTAQAEAVQATVARVRRFSHLPGVVASFLRARNLPPRLVMADDPVLTRWDWHDAMLEVRQGPVEDDDAVGLTRAFAGIAETGSLMLLSSPERPTMLAFLPETCLVVLPTDRMAGAYEDAWRMLRSEEGTLPRSINLITGPSRTADIEQTLQLGAHGPKRLHVLLVDEAPNPVA